jgi:hypothetical protein
MNLKDKRNCNLIHILFEGDVKNYSKLRFIGVSQYGYKNVAAPSKINLGDRNFGKV